MLFDETQRRKRPEERFYLFCLPAKKLRQLSGIYRRTADQPRRQDVGIQRRHEERRSKEISRFVLGGLPWSSVSNVEIAEQRYPDLIMPGWLPTAIIANILPPGAVREGERLTGPDTISIEADSSGSATVILPEGLNDPAWRPIVPPIEIVDGQHRLWAFDELSELEGDFEMPVVAFFGLDVAWQAYLFWTINIKPKRINASLAFDLYPILRTQEWMERIEGPKVYREARAQEITEMLWSYPRSPWHGRINMIGDPKGGDVTQASFIRSLLASYVKRWEGPGITIGGLFGSELGAGTDYLEWSRVQQAAFFVAVWQEVEAATSDCTEPWAEHLRSLYDDAGRIDQREEAPFLGPQTLLATDQGVRAVLQVTNDLCYLRASALRLGEWRTSDLEDDPTTERLDRALESLASEVRAFLADIARSITAFDWRTSSTPGLDSEAKLRQAAFRGSGGYRDLRHQLLLVLGNSSAGNVSAAASEALRILNYGQP